MTTIVSTFLQTHVNLIIITHCGKVLKTGGSDELMLSMLGAADRALLLNCMTSTLTFSLQP